MSFKELFGLCAGMGEHDMERLNSSRSARRRSGQKSMDATRGLYAQEDDQSSSSSRSSTSPQSSTVPDPSSLPSTETRSSAYESDSELSSAPSNLSDCFSSPEPPVKRRKTEAAITRQPQKPRRPSTETLANLEAATLPNERRDSLPVVLKLSSNKLARLDHDPWRSSHETSHQPSSPPEASVGAEPPHLLIRNVPDSTATLSQYNGQISRLITSYPESNGLSSPPETPGKAKRQGPSKTQSFPNVTHTQSQGGRKFSGFDTETPGLGRVMSPLPEDLAITSQTLPSDAKRKRGKPKKSTSYSSSQPPALENVAIPSMSGAGDSEQPPLHQTITKIPDPIPDDLQPLFDISKQLIALSSCPIDKKPLPIGAPEVWADGRQALCESLPYYRSYQSAGYCTGGFAVSFMFDQEGSARDYMDSEVVIARSGGGLSKDKSTGKMARQADQTESSQVKSVRNSMEQFNPVAILSGNRNLQCPSKMPHVYNVLDWFKPTHIWYEKVDGMVNIRYRFEKLRKEEQSWWASSEGPEPTKIGDQQPPNIRSCTQCQLPSHQVYLQGWMCLQPDCPQFWRLASGEEPQESGLLYDPRFLKQHTPWPHSSAPQPLRPDHLTLGPTPVLGDDVSWAAAKGLVCPKCGRCNSREDWKGWECGNSSCDFTHSLPHANVPADALHDAYNPLSSGYATSKDWFSPIIPFRVEFTHNYRINYFTIPGVDGFIAHFIANKTINEEPGGPDDMWTELQTADLGLRRRPLGCHTLQGPMLTQHFSVNYGMPYKFIAATASRPFDTAAAPRAIAATRSRLNWAARHCVGPEKHAVDDEFNELLALGYFERQKIDYHDDGEHGLGSTVATLSLGAPAAMRVRLKAKHHHGVSRAGAYVNRPPVPGALKYEERAAAHAELERLKHKSQATDNDDGDHHHHEIDEEGDGDGDATTTYRARLKALPHALGLQAARGNAKDVLNMHLGHGDIVVIHGARIQEYYEHAVEPAGRLRFALTCRYIDPGSLRPEDRPAYAVGPDEGAYDGSRLPAAV